MKKYKQLLSLMLAGMISLNGAPQLYAEENEAVEDIVEEDDDAEDAEAVPDEASDVSQDAGSDSKSASGGNLLVDPNPTSSGGLQDGLSIAASVRSQFETDPIVTVDPSQYPAANFSENAREVYWYCRLQLGLNHAAACGVLANVQLESSFRPLAIGDGGTSYGICQWHLGRCTALMSYCTAQGLDYNTLEGQLAYLTYELNGGYNSVYRALLNVEDSAQGAFRAAWIMCVSFEIPDQADARGQQRGNLAMNNFYPMDFAETASFKPIKALTVTAEASENSVKTAVLGKNTEVTLVDGSITDGRVQIIFRQNGDEQTGYVDAASLEHIKETDPLTSDEEIEEADAQADEIKRSVETTDETEEESETETETEAETADEADVTSSDNIQENITETTES